MAESRIRNENYFQVNGWMLTRLGLKGTALQLYAIIYGFSQDGESSFTGSLQYLSDFTNSSKPTVIKALKELVDRGYVLKTENLVNGVKLNTYKANLQVVKKLYWGSQDSLPGGSKETLPGGSQDSLPNNKSFNNKGFDNKGDKKGPSPTPAEMPETSGLFGEELQKAFDDWLKYKGERKEEYLPTGLKNLISEIRNNAKEYGEAAVAAEIRKSISSGWKGIIFERLKEARQKQGGRKEIVPSWMTQDGKSEMAKYAMDMRQRQKTVDEDPELKARAEELRQKLQRGN